MKDASSQCLFRPQVEVAQEVLRTRDFLIGLEKVTLHPALKEEWKVVSDLNVGIVEVLRLKQPVLVALFIARPLGEATASEKAEVIHSVHAQLKELKAMGGKGGFEEFANWVIPPPPGQGSVWGVPPGPADPTHHASGGFKGGVFSSGVSDFGSAYMEGLYGGGPGHYGLTNGRSHRARGGRGGRGGGGGRGPAVCRMYTLAGSTSTNHPQTICPLKECFECGKSGHVPQLCLN